MPRKKKVTEKPMTLSLRDAKASNDRQMIPADNVDAEGKAWATVGENIRKGKNGSGSSGGGGDATLTKETIANFYNALTGGDWRVADMTIRYKNGANEAPSVEYHDVDYSDQLLVWASGVMCKSGIMGTPIYLGAIDPMSPDLMDATSQPMFFISQVPERGNVMKYIQNFRSQGVTHARVLLPFQYADSRANSWSHNVEDDWNQKVQKWQKEDAEAVQKAISEEHKEV